MNFRWEIVDGRSDSAEMRSEMGGLDRAATMHQRKLKNDKASVARVYLGACDVTRASSLRPHKQPTGAATCPYHAATE